MTVSDLEKGQKVYITRISNGVVEGKLLGMGVKAGSEITLIRKTNFNKTFYIKVGTSRMAIRSEEAAFIEISSKESSIITQHIYQNI